MSEQGRHTLELIDQQAQAQVELINQRAYQQFGLTPVVPQGLEHLAGQVFRSEHGLVVDDGSDTRMLAAAALLDGDGTAFVVDMHGADGIPQAGGQGLTPEDFPKLLAAGGWNGQPIVLLACATGGPGASFAAEVAALPQLRGVEVFAADAGVWQLVGNRRLWLGRVWSDEHNMMMPADHNMMQPAGPDGAGGWWGHRYENGRVAVRPVGVTRDGMPVTDPAVAGAPTAAASENRQPGLAGGVSGHAPLAAPPAARPEDWIVRGPGPGQPDPVLARRVSRADRGQRPGTSGGQRRLRVAARGTRSSGTAGEGGHRFGRRGQRAAPRGGGQPATAHRHRRPHRLPRAGALAMG